MVGPHEEGDVSEIPVLREPGGGVVLEDCGGEAVREGELLEGLEVVEEGDDGDGALSVVDLVEGYHGVAAGVVEYQARWVGELLDFEVAEAVVVAG